MANEVSEPIPEWKLDVENRRIVDDLLGGTARMRKAGETYLPKEEAETATEFEKRLARTTLFNAFKRTVSSLTGKPFAKDVRKTGMPSNILDWMEDIDLRGNSFDVFIKETFRHALADGIRFILVDFPFTVDEEGVTPNLQQERAQNLRPYFVDVDPRNLIGWQTEQVNGIEVLTQARLKEIIRRPDTSNRFQSQLIERIRVFHVGGFEVWERVVSTPQTRTSQRPRTPTESDFDLVSTGTMSIDEIPIVAVYTNEVAFFVGAPSMIDLMYMNIEHWQSKSDQNNILHVSRVPILYGAGFSDTEMGLVQVGGKRSINNSNSDAKLTFTELQGKSIESGAKSLEDLENRMRIEGLEMLIKKQTVTATERMLDSKDLDSELAGDVRSSEDSFIRALRLMLSWVGENPDNVGTIDIHKDFGIAFRDVQELQQLFQARRSGEITQETYLGELQRRGVLGPDIDVEDEVENTETAPPGMFPNLRFGSTGPGATVTTSTQN